MSNYLTRDNITILNTNAAVSGANFAPRSNKVSFQATEAGTGAISSTITIWTTNEPTNANSWILVCTITLSGTTTAKDASPTYPVLNWVRASTATTDSGAILGTNAVVNVTMSN